MLSNDDDLYVGSVSYVGELNVSLIPKPLISQLVVSVGISPTYCKQAWSAISPTVIQK